MNSYKCCSKTSKESIKISSSLTLLKIVTEESRLKLLCILKVKAHCVNELMKHVKMSQSLVSHHLRDLKEAGIVESQKKGLFVYYSLTDKGRRIVDLLFKI